MVTELEAATRVEACSVRTPECKQGLHNSVLDTGVKSRSQLCASVSLVLRRIGMVQVEISLPRLAEGNKTRISQRVGNHSIQRRARVKWCLINRDFKLVLFIFKSDRKEWYQQELGIIYVRRIHKNILY